MTPAKIDAKHRVLYAIYAAYQKDLPDMPSVAFGALDTVSLDSVIPTRFGIEYVEQKLEIERAATGAEKLRALAGCFRGDRAAPSNMVNGLGCQGRISARPEGPVRSSAPPFQQGRSATAAL